MAAVSDHDRERVLRVRIEDDIPVPGAKRSRRFEVKKTRRVFKTAQITEFGPAEEERVSKRQLDVRTFPSKNPGGGGGYDFKRPTHSWGCEDDEIDDLRDFLNLELGGAGEKVVVNSDSALGELARLATAGDLEAGHLEAVLDALVGTDAQLRELAKLDVARLIGAAAELHRHQGVIERLQALVDDAATTEHQLSKLLSSEWWLFGHRYVSLLDRQQITGWDRLDFALERTDGAIHIIEIKRANAPLVVQHGSRPHHVVSPDVSYGVGQAAHYLKEVDAMADNLGRRVGGSWIRCHATVVIGHPAHAAKDVTPEAVRETLRTYNSHLSRIEVLTYEDLLETARRDVQSLSGTVHDQSTDDGGSPHDWPPASPPPPADDDVPF